MGPPCDAGSASPRSRHRSRAIKTYVRSKTVLKSNDIHTRQNVEPLPNVMCVFERGKNVQTQIIRLLLGQRDLRENGKSVTRNRARENKTNYPVRKNTPTLKTKIDR